nr:uncharacterized protein LOC117987242 [Maniola hyperantus]
MCLKRLILVSIYIIVHAGETVADDTVVSQEFEQLLSDFIVQYQKDNATDGCKTPAEKYTSINEELKKSNLFEEFQLEKYFAEDSKCENLCFKVNYTIEAIINYDYGENVVNDNMAPTPVPSPISDIVNPKRKL